MESADLVDDIKKDLTEIMRPEFIDAWIRTPNKAFEDRTPLDLIQSGEVLRIRRMIHELRSGQPG